jgi:site-specific recombinase XerD
LTIHLKEQRNKENSTQSDQATYGEQFAAIRYVPKILKGDAVYDVQLDRFLLDLPANGLVSRHSLRGYGYDIVVWVRFLEQARNKSLWDADRTDVTAFHTVRRNAEATNRIAGSSWNRSVAALDKLYRWGVEEGLITQSPFSYRQVWKRPYGGGSRANTTTNASYERAVKRSDVRFLMLEDFHSFRDVGLLGLQTDGRPRIEARDRNGIRNALFAELVITTGLRLDEAASLLVTEVREAIEAAKPGYNRQLAFRLPPGLTKGNKGRTIRMPARLLARLQTYLTVERALAVAKFGQRDTANIMKDAIFCKTTRPGRFLLRCGPDSWVNTPLDRLTPDERRSLVLCNEEGLPQEPAALWLSEVGRPISPNCWEVVFARASERCHAAGISLDVNPHQLRHSFAVHMLSLLIRESFGRDSTAAVDPTSIPYRRLLGDPLQQVQRLLGHSSLETTYIYLDHLAGCQSAVDSAADLLFGEIANKLVPVVGR